MSEKKAVEEMSLYQEFESHVSARFDWAANEPVVVAVSGGVDSIVLLDLLTHLPQHLKPACIITHINHHLRAESNEEEQFVRQLAESKGLPIRVHQWEKASHPNSGIEEAARHIRYQFFSEVAREEKARNIITAHHKNDQVETIMMKWVRGSSLEEMVGIKEMRASGNDRILRPLLPFTKGQLIQHAKTKGLRWKEDMSNQSLDYSRNRFRHTILPYLKEENSAIEEHVVRFANEVKELLDIVTPLVDEEVKHTTVATKESLTIDIHRWLNLNEALRKRVLIKALILWNGEGKLLVKQTHIQLINDWLQESKPNASLDLSNGLMAKRNYGRCLITYKANREPNLNERKEHVIDRINTWIQLNRDEKIGLFTKNVFEEMRLEQASVLHLGNKLTMPLTIRHRRDGDRMVIKGMDGTKKLKSIFIDDKVPLQDRDQAWVVEDHNGTIVWLINYRESSLSLNPITDTIIYVLVYQKDT